MVHVLFQIEISSIGRSGEIPNLPFDRFAEKIDRTQAKGQTAGCSCATDAGDPYLRWDENIKITNDGSDADNSPRPGAGNPFLIGSYQWEIIPFLVVFSFLIRFSESLRE
jgi:hypothetical protein